MKKLGYFLFASLLLLGCGKVPINEKGKPIHPFNDGFENKSLSIYDLLLVSDSLVNTTFVSSPTRNGKFALKTVLRSTDFVYNGYRTELAIYNSSFYKSEAYYGLSFYIDSNYQDDSYTLLCQWQDLPDYLQGESWTSTPVLHGSPPPIFLHYVDGKLELKGNESTMQSDQTFAISPSISIEKGKWYDFTAHIYWDDTDKGYIEAWLNKEYITPSNGVDNKFYKRNLYNRSGNYFKFGQYHGGIKPIHSNIVYFDEVKIGSTFQSVQP